MANEPLPAKDVLTEFSSQWVSNNVTTPNFTEVTGAGEPLRLDLNVADQVVGKVGSPAIEEQPIGNYKYGNRTYNVDLEVYTLDSRQRLYNLVQEIRRIVHARMHNLTNFQRMRFMNFNELTQEQVNVWAGTVTIQLENRAILLET